MNSIPRLSILLVALMLFSFSSCDKKIDIVAANNALLEQDRQFSRHSEEVGPGKAFLDYIDDDAVLLRSNRYPIIGREKITEMYSKPDSGFVLTWEPSFAQVANSGEMGYTYGIYTAKTASPDGEPVISYGTYVTIWKKDPDGNWKFVLDTGNPGLERKKPDLD